MAADESDHSKLLRRLERRLDREQRARFEAEQIAEAGIRSLYDANQDLDRRILERTAELNAALEAAEAANNAKSAFLGQMSHQINTPLNGLLGMLELLAGELTDDRARDWHASATRSAHRLERLTTRLIIYVELEGTDLRVRSSPRRLSEILSGVHDRWHGACLGAAQILAVELRPGAEALIYGPPEIDLMFDELLSNVVEHVGPGAVNVVARPSTDGSEVVVQIQDPGEGITTVVRERASDLDALPDQTRRGDDPINLGLALVDRIVEGLGGTWGPVDDGLPAIEVRLPTVVEATSTQ